MGHKSRLDQGRLDPFGKDLVGDLKFLPRRIDPKAQPLRPGDLLGLGAREPVGVARGLADEVLVAHLTPRGAKVDVLPARRVAQAEAPVSGPHYLLHQRLEEFPHQSHHPAEIRVGLVDLQHRELRIVFPGNTLVPEDPPDLKYPVEATDEHPLET